MADAISIQELIDARTDAKTLEEAVNGNAVTTVLSRLGETYPTLSNALNQIDGQISDANDMLVESVTTLFTNGGLPATPFATKALMTASALVDGQYAMVTNDTVNNGLYVKTAGAWVESEYSIDNLISKYVTHNSANNLIEFKDGNDELYLLVTPDGSMILPNLKHPVQDYLSNQEPESVQVIDDGGDVLRITDSNDDLVAMVTKDGSVVAKNFVTPHGDLNHLIENINNGGGGSTEIPTVNIANKYRPPFQYMDGLRVANQPKTNKKVVLTDVAEIGNGYQSLWAPCLARTGKNSYYMCFDVRKSGGDYDPIYIAGRTLSYDPETQEFEKGEIQRLSQDGIGSDGIPYSFLNPNITYVESGKNVGRILIHFNYMNNPASQSDRKTLPYYIYSDDGGANFTDPIPMEDMFDFSDVDEDRTAIFGTGHGIQMRYGKYKDRLIFPCYTRNPLSNDKNLHGKRATTSRIIYSDDGGDTFKMGDPVGALSNTNECQAAELDDGRLLVFMRLYSGVNRKYQVYSSDGGETFGAIEEVSDIRGAGTKNGFLQCANIYDYSLPKLVVLSPRTPDEKGGLDGRINPHLWVSYDGGRTYPYRKQIATGLCQYSDIQTIDPDHILAAYNGGTHSRGNLIYGHIINLNFLIGEQQ